MSIRVRKDGTMWCSAHTKEEPGDTYIDDGLHYEMSVETGVIVALPMPEHVDHPQWWWIGQAPPECDFRGRTESGRMIDDDGNWVPYSALTTLTAERDALLEDNDQMVRSSLEAAFEHDRRRLALTASQAEVASLRAALTVADVALCDWLNTYAPDMCDPKRVEESVERVHSQGTIAYIAKVLATVRAALLTHPA